MGHGTTATAGFRVERHFEIDVTFVEASRETIFSSF